MARQVILSPRAKRDLAGLPQIIANEIVAALRLLADRKLLNADIKKLHGRNPPEYRLRIGNYRMVFLNEGNNIRVIRVGDRKDIYR